MASTQASAAHREAVVQTDLAVSDPKRVTTDQVVDVIVAPLAVPAVPSDRISVQGQIDAYVRHQLDGNDAWMRIEAEKIHRVHVSRTPPHADKIVAALRLDPEPARHRQAESETVFYAALDQDRGHGIALAERRRMSAAPRSVAAVTAEVPEPKTVLAASAASEPAPTSVSMDAAIVASRDMKAGMVPAPQPITLFAPNHAFVAKNDGFLAAYLAIPVASIVIGILFGLYLTNRRSRISDDEARAPYEDIPDGTLLIQEIRNGAVCRTFTVMTDIQLRKTGLDLDVMKTIERKWLDPLSSDAAIVANDEACLASGSGQISSQGREKHSVGGEITVIPKDEAPKAIDTPETILYEDQPAPSN